MADCRRADGELAADRAADVCPPDPQPAAIPVREPTGPAHVLALQRSAGNVAVGRVLARSPAAPASAQKDHSQLAIVPQDNADRTLDLDPLTMEISEFNGRSVAHMQVANARYRSVASTREEDALQPPYGPALDLGCGSGVRGITLAKRGWRVTGVDIVEKALRRARDRVDAAGLSDIAKSNLSADRRVGPIAGSARSGRLSRAAQPAIVSTTTS